MHAMISDYSKSIANAFVIAATLLPAIAYSNGILPTPEEVRQMAEKSKGTPEHNLYMGRIAFLDYDFEKAARLYKTYSTAKKKAAVGEELLPRFEGQLEIAEESLGNVQKLQLISKTQIPESDFTSAIRLPGSAGTLLPPDSIPFPQGRDEATMAFANESRDYMLWSQRVSRLSEEDTEEKPEGNEDGIYMIVESERLTDGSWSEPTPLRGLGDTGIDADFPFMRADGTTLYFSSPSKGSMGGYDLFVATRDPQTGEYLAPRNLGMPFNSPYDDLLVAVDEENGMGWLVSDRDRADGKVALYLYILEESRSNHDPEAPEITDHARLTADEDFLPADSEIRADKLNALDNISNKKRNKQRDFLISIPGGRIYERVENFTSPQARLAAGRYLGAMQARKRDMETLDRLRREYHDAAKSGNRSKTQFIETRILQLEEAVRERGREIKELRNQAIQAETMR